VKVFRLIYTHMYNGVGLGTKRFPVARRAPGSTNGVVEGKPALETMKQMVDAVEGIVNTFEPLLS
jgi:hypothetical protein